MDTRTEAGRRRPVFARHAASLLLVQNGPAGPEVLMGRRAAAHRFMPGALVFPGGGVDRGDAILPAATEPDPSLLDALRRSCGPRLARGIAVCAARELREETGLFLGDPPRLHALRYLCRAITPPDSPIRFNARFLVAPAEAAEGTLADSAELSALAFRPASAVLDGELALVTREVLLRLLAPPAAEEPGSRMVFRLRSWVRDR